MIRHRHSATLVRYTTAGLAGVVAFATFASPAAAVATAPSQISRVTVASGASTLIVRFAAPNANGSPIIRYVAKCVGNGKTISASSAAPPVRVNNVANNVFYSCSVHAANAIGVGPESYVSPGMAGLNYDKTTYTYCSPGGVPQLMDFFRPKGDTVVPAVMFVHGGGWYSGNRMFGASLLPTLLTSRGFALASVDYRLAPAVNPAQQLRDIACAVRFMRSHAGALGITPDKIGGMGTSAGGNLISMLGVNPPKVSSTDQWSGRSEKLQAVIDEYGVTEFGPDQMQIMPALYYYFGTRDQSVIDSYGPVKYVTPDDSPVMIVHGVLDRTVPIHEGSDFYNLLQAAHVPSTFVPIANADHMFEPVGGNPSPSMVTVYTGEIRFLAQYLK